MDHTFHSDTLHEVLSWLETDQEQGLSLQEGEKRLAEHGENRLEEDIQAGMLRRVLGQLNDPMILVLLAAAALSFFAGGGQDWLDAAIILLIVLFNTVISVSQEDNARKALEVIASVPLDRILIESDAPYLSPVPHRGERNRSDWLSAVAETVARHQGISREEAEDITFRNGKRFYRIP